MSPCSLVTGRTVDYNKHCKYEFGQYVQVHDQRDNSMQPHMTGAIALCPTGNTQGNYYFMSLISGRKLNQVLATPLPMPDDVISRVHMLARHQTANPGIVFMNREEQLLDDLEDYYYDDDDDEDYNIEEEDDQDDGNYIDEENDNNTEEDDEDSLHAGGYSNDDDSDYDDNIAVNDESAPLDGFVDHELQLNNDDGLDGNHAGADGTECNQTINEENEVEDDD